MYSIGAIKDAIDRRIFNYSDTFPDSPRRLLFVESKGEALTLRSYLNAWHETQQAHLKESTWDDYRKTIKRINASLGHIILAELKRSDVRGFLCPMKVSNKTLANLQSPLRKALQDAVDDEIIGSNPLYDWTYSRQEAPKTTDDVDPFTKDEQTAILAELMGQGKNLIQFALWTGMRTSELVVNAD